MSRTVVYSPTARDHLEEIYRWVAENSGYPDRTLAYVEAIIDFCDDLAGFPNRGRLRDDLRPGLRTIGFRRRVVTSPTR